MAGETQYSGIIRFTSRTSNCIPFMVATLKGNRVAMGYTANTPENQNRNLAYDGNENTHYTYPIENAYHGGSEGSFFYAQFDLTSFFASIPSNARFIAGSLGVLAKNNGSNGYSVVALKETNSIEDDTLELADSWNTYVGNISSIPTDTATYVKPFEIETELTKTELIDLIGTRPVLLFKATTYPTSEMYIYEGAATFEYYIPVAPSVSFTIDRTDSTGEIKDEDENAGTYAVISASFDYLDNRTTLQQPNVKIDGTAISATWYTDRALTEPVNWTDYNPVSPIMLYTIIGGQFSTQQSYSIGITPIDGIMSGSEISQILSGAFYTIDFLAGGHGIAFGQPCNQEGFFCSMDAYFKDKTNLVRALFDFMYPVGSYYETSDTDFNPNDTWGGTWILETEGLVHISAGTNYAVAGALNNEKDGGATTSATGNHTLTYEESGVPAHTHGMAHTHSHNHLSSGYIKANAAKGTHAATPVGYNNSNRDGQYTSDTDATASSKSATDNNTAKNATKAHNHGNVSTMQPYIIVNRWHRTA